MSVVNEVDQGLDEVKVVGIRPGVRGEFDCTSGDLDQWIDQGSQLADFSTALCLGLSAASPS